MEGPNTEKKALFNQDQLLLHTPIVGFREMRSKDPYSDSFSVGVIQRYAFINPNLDRYLLASLYTLSFPSFALNFFVILAPDKLSLS
jgi:hypothetical protein